MVLVLILKWTRLIVKPICKANATQTPGRHLSVFEDHCSPEGIAKVDFRFTQTMIHYRLKNGNTFTIKKKAIIFFLH